MKANLNAFTAVLKKHYPQVGILLGSLLLSLSMGPYSNWDAQLEFEAASNVLTKGFPFLSTGFMINQPPLGFYLDAPIFKTFGLSYATGANITAAFALGSVALVYAIGTMLYEKRTGLLAAALFGLTPWQVFMSRVFLVDAQCLFLSLLYLLVGIWAIQKSSEKLLFTAGTIFALALMTKLFSVFMLIPLLAIYHVERTRGFKLTPKRATLFLFPALLLQVIWYGGFANQNFVSVYFNSDFIHPLQTAALPSLFFLPEVLTQSTGWSLLIAATASALLALSRRKLFAENLISDYICTATIAGILGLDLLLVFGFNLNVPYVSAFKYGYQALPFLCLLAASLATKSSSIMKRRNIKGKRSKMASFAAVVGLAVSAAAMVESATFLYNHASNLVVTFRVDAVAGYPFQLLSQPMQSGYVHAIQFAAFFLIALSLLAFFKFKNAAANSAQNRPLKY